MLVFLSDEELRATARCTDAPSRRRWRPAAGSLAGKSAAVLARLAALMDVERVYRRPSLSVKELADLVQTPEYRVRKIIHEQLRYANFNAFLHVITASAKLVSSCAIPAMRARFPS